MILNHKKAKFLLTLVLVLFISACSSNENAIALDLASEIAINS